MTDATRIATLEAQLEVVAADRDSAREMLREMGRENAKLRANLAVMTEAYRENRAALLDSLSQEAQRLGIDYASPSPATPSEGAWDRLTEEEQTEVLAASEAGPSEGRCTECHGAGLEGTGQPSDEGGEAFRDCHRCGGSGRATPRGQG